MEQDMEQLKDVIYAPCLRSSQYDLLALKEIEAPRRKLITPIISARGNNLGLIQDFARNWEGECFWLDVSRFSLAIAAMARVPQQKSSP